LQGFDFDMTSSDFDMTLDFYYICYTGEIELNYISTIVNEFHNHSTHEIQSMYFARIINNQFSIEKYLFLFGIDPGNRLCTSFFELRGIQLQKYLSKDIDVYLEPMEQWYSYREKYFPDDFADMMYKQNFANWFTYKQRKLTLQYIKKHKTFWSNDLLHFDDLAISEIHREIRKQKREDRASRK